MARIIPLSFYIGVRITGNSLLKALAWATGHLREHIVLLAIILLPFVAASLLLDCSNCWVTLVRHRVEMIPRAATALAALANMAFILLSVNADHMRLRGHPVFIFFFVVIIDWGQLLFVHDLGEADIDMCQLFYANLVVRVEWVFWVCYRCCFCDIVKHLALYSLRWFTNLVTTAFYHLSSWNSLKISICPIWCIGRLW